MEPPDWSRLSEAEKIEALHRAVEALRNQNETLLANVQNLHRRLREMETKLGAKQGDGA
jgi:hypothetical protein